MVSASSIYFLLLLSLPCQAQEGPIVETLYGSIRGLVDTTETGLVYENYLGVPFAKPPLGDLRFAKTTPPEPWEEILNTTEFAKGCIEVNSTGTSEDCLYLNVYVPGQNRSGDGLAVMVFVHGGAYRVGDTGLYPAEELATHGDVIVVSITYRLGALGFLSTENEAAPGNYGLWDVKLALEWVRDNIAAFGGSPDTVTVFGQSAGGAITSHVMISPETQNLFQRGICMSGTSTSPFGVALPGALSTSTEILALTLGCPVLNDSYALVDCLRQEDPYEINYWATRANTIVQRHSIHFLPVIDGEFIPQHPAATWNESAPSHLDLITGAVIHDGAGVILVHPSGPNTTINLAETKESIDTALKFTMNGYPGNYDDIKEAIVGQYAGIDDNDTSVRTQSAVQVYTDYNFDTGHHYEASHHSLVFGSTYLYEYAYPNSFWRPFIYEEYEWLIAEHFDDMISTFGEGIVNNYIERVLGGEFSEADKEMSSQLRSYFTNFAKNGDPNEGLEVPVFWPQYTRENTEFLQFSENTEVLSETEEMMANYRFWIYDFPLVAVPDR